MYIYTYLLILLQPNLAPGITHDVSAVQQVQRAVQRLCWLGMFIQCERSPLQQRGEGATRLAVDSTTPSSSSWVLAHKTGVADKIDRRFHRFHRKSHRALEIDSLPPVHRYPPPRQGRLRGWLFHVGWDGDETRASRLDVPARGAPASLVGSRSSLC